MLKWCLEHPWLTCLIVLVLIEAMDNIIANICKTIVITKKNKQYAKGENSDEDIIAR